MKKKSLFATVGAGLSLALAAVALGGFLGNQAKGVAATTSEVDYYELCGTTQTFGAGYTAAFTAKNVVNNGTTISWGGMGVNSGSSWTRFGGKSTLSNLKLLNADATNYPGIVNDTGAFIQSETGSSVAISKLTLTTNAASPAYAGAAYLEVASSAFAFDTTVATEAAVKTGHTDLVRVAVASGTVSGTTLTFVPTSGAEWAAGSYFRFIFEGVFTTSNTYLSVSSFKFSRITTLVNPTGVTVAAAASTIDTIGGTTTVTATVTPADATDKTVTWSSSNKAIASVDELGVVTATGKGTATITATCNGDTSISGSALINVTASVSGLDNPYVVDKGISNWSSTKNHYERDSIEQGIVYRDLEGYTYTKSSVTYLSLDKVAGAYIANLSTYARNIKKIVVVASASSTFTDLALYAGTSPVPTANAITGTASIDGLTETYDLSSGSYQYFNLARTAIANYVNITSITVTINDTALSLATYIMNEDVANQCTTKYALAKTRFLEMTAAEQTLFQTAQSGEDAIITNARARYEAWAINQKDAAPYASGAAAVDGLTSSTGMIAIAVVSVLGLLTLAGVVVLKKKHN